MQDFPFINKKKKRKKGGRDGWKLTCLVARGASMCKLELIIFACHVGKMILTTSRWQRQITKYRYGRKSSLRRIARVNILVAR